MGRISEGIVVEPTIKPAYLKAALVNFFVYLLVVVAASVAADKSDDSVSLPATVADVLAHEMVTPWNPVTISGGLRQGEYMLNFGADCRTQAFIGIQYKYPGVLHLWNSPVFLVGRSLIGSLFYPYFLPTCVLGGTVGAERIYNEDIVSPAS
jgi:hypothetical protein